MCYDAATHVNRITSRLKLSAGAGFCVIVAPLVLFATQPQTNPALPEGVNLASMHEWNIVTDERALASEFYAAQEFQDLFALATGVRLPIVHHVDRVDRHIFIGPSSHLTSSSVGFSTEPFGPEDLRIVVRNRNIAIAGGQPRGTLYGVYVFLEEYVGVRFLTATHTYVPPVGKWRVVGPVDRFYRPPLAFRWNDVGENEDNPAFAARLRCNGYRPVNNPTAEMLYLPDHASRPRTADSKLGGVSGWVLTNHSFSRQIPSGTYGQVHPEYFCLIDGARRAGPDEHGERTQPCLTNPDVLRIVTGAVLKEIKQKPDQENFSVSPNDNQHYCQCDTCRAIEQREGSSIGPLLTLVNAVADRVAVAHPDKEIGTLAYQASRKPPRTVVPRPNVQIELCNIECSMVQPIDDPSSELNRAFRDDLEAWGRICDNIHVWAYNANFRDYLLPLPNLYTLDANIRFFVANNARGVYFEAAHALGSSFCDLRNYVTCRLLWDPTLDGKVLIDEFVRLHYGSAAEPIRTFVNLFHENAIQKRIERTCLHPRAAEWGIDAQITQAGLQAFAKALQLADDDAVRGRVEKASICAYRAAVEDAWLWAVGKREQLGSEKMPDDIAQRTRPHLKRLFELCRTHGVTHWSQHATISEARGLLYQAFGLAKDDDF